MNALKGNSYKRSYRWLNKKNPDFIERIDNEILNQFGPKALESENIKSL